MAKAGRPRKPCGTYAAYRRHKGMNEPIDEACQAAADWHYENRYKNKTPKPAPVVKAPVVVKVPFGWRQSAACAESDLDWFPDEDQVVEVAACVAVCEGCVVRNECLSAALAESTISYDLGIRGGLKPSERAALRRMLKVSA